MESNCCVLASDLNIIKSAGGARAAICMDRRLKKDLVEQGILSVEDLSKVNVSRFRPNFDVPFAEYARRRDFARNQEVPAGTGSRQRVQR